MREVVIGPKSLRSEIPVGTVSSRVYEEILDAEVGQLGKQIYNFNMYLGVEVVNGERVDRYYRAFVVNGHCRFKKYNLFDRLKYKLFKMLFSRG